MTLRVSSLNRIWMILQGTVYKCLNASADYVAENDRKHPSMSAALNQYLLFVEDIEARYGKE